MPTVHEQSAENDLVQIKDLVAKLYLNLNVQEHEKQKENEILNKLDTLRAEIEPLEKVFLLINL